MARRHHQTGCLFKKGQNWVFRYREYQIGSDGTVNPVHRSVSFGAITRLEASRARDALQRRLALAGERPKAAMTLKEFWTGFFDPHIIQKKQPSTQELYAHLFRNHIDPHLGSTVLSEIGRFHIQEFISKKEAEGYAPQTVAHLRDALSKALGTAALWGWINDNPTKGVTLPRMQRRRVPRVLTFQEIAKLREALAEPARTMLVLGVLLGLRIGELLGLKLEDVDLQNGMLSVRRAVCRGNVGPTKTPGSERRFPLPDQTVEMLGEYIAGRKVESEWFFPTLRGGFHNDRTLFIRYVKPVIKKLELPHFSWHSFRHTFLTYNGNDGVAMPILQSLAGHTNAQTTLRYIDTFADRKRAVLEQWAEQLFPTVPSKKR